MTEFINYLSQLPLVWVYFIIFLVAYIENIFPPAPSDVVVVFGGALAAINSGSVFLAIGAATVGSTLGFMTMYIIGSWLGANVIERRTFKHFSKEGLHKVEGWFARYGYWLIIANRFLSGTRAVVSFFAGLSQLDFTRTSILSFFSSLTWYSILVYAGYSMGSRWETIGEYLQTYGKIITLVIITIGLLAALRYYWKRRKPANG